MARPTHILAAKDPLGDRVVLVQTTAKSRVSVAIKVGLAECVRVWSSDLSMWIIDRDVLDDMCRCVEAIDTDGPWCSACADRMESITTDPCGAFDVDLLENEYGFEVRKRERKMEFPKIPDVVKKLFASEAGAVGLFLKGRVKDGLKKYASASGINVSDQFLDELFEAAYQASKGNAAPKGSGMTEADAATILRCAWPCSKEEIIAAYRVEAKRTHPDMGGNAAAFQRVVSAREVLIRAL